MSTRIRDKRKIGFVCLQFCSKDKNKTAHWIGHSKLRSLDIYEFFKITSNFDEKATSVTGKIEEEKKQKKNIDDAD